MKILQFARRSLELVTIFSLALSGVGQAYAQASRTFIGTADFINKTYATNGTVMISGVTNSVQSNSIVFFGGSRSRYTNAPADNTNNPHVRLVWSGFGQPVAPTPLRSPDLLLGQKIDPPVGFNTYLGLDARSTNNGNLVFYLADVNQLFAADPGYVTIIWSNSISHTITNKTYLISSVPTNSPELVFMWVTDTNGVTVGATGAPGIDFTNSASVIPHYNTAVTSNVLAKVGNQLRATNGTGRIVLEIRTNGILAGVQTLQIRPYPDGTTVYADVGRLLLPTSGLAGTNDVKPLVTRGINEPLPYAYQENRVGTANYPNAVYAVRPALAGSQIEIFWFKRSVGKVVWPYEMHRYTADWNNADARQRIYWTEDNTGARTKAPLVNISNVISPRLFYNDQIPSSSYVWWDANRMLHATGVVARILFQYNSNSFEFVDVLPYSAIGSPDITTYANVGTFLSPSNSPVGPKGRPFVSDTLTADPMHWVYQDNVAGDFHYGDMFVARVAQYSDMIDIFWRQVGISNVVWPYEWHRYAAGWPGEFDTIKRRIYWTEQDNTIPTRAPTIVIPSSAVPNVVIHYNPDIPPNQSNQTGSTNSSFWQFISGQNVELHAKHYRGNILIHYENPASTNAFLGAEYVEVVAYSPDVPNDPISVGDQLGPRVLPQPDPQPPHPLVTHGIALDPTHYAYQHTSPSGDSPLEGQVFSVRQNTDPLNLEVFWLRYGLLSIVWPYEMHRYTATWPTNLPSKYQLYVRGDGPLGPTVTMAPNFNATLVEDAQHPFEQLPIGHASIANNQFQATLPGPPEGWSLIRYTPSNNVLFQVVRSVFHTNTTPQYGFVLTPQPGTNGLEITDGYHQTAYSPAGYVFIPIANPHAWDRYDWEAYNGDTNRPAEPPTGQIIPVNNGKLEVWWYNLNKTVAWPSLVKRYTNSWPANAEPIVIASTRGSRAMDPSHQKNYRLYVQNNINRTGFNPNDEHALIRDNGDGDAVFALRSDLGTNTTSQPFVLLKYNEQTDLDSGIYRWYYKVWQVLGEGMSWDGTNYTFTYRGTAGTLVQPPFPLSIIDLPPSPQNTNVSGPAWRDRKKNYWAKAGGDNGGPADIVMRWWYPVQSDFYFPDHYLTMFPSGLPKTNVPPSGSRFPWLDLYAHTAGTPQNITYTIRWPSQVPVLRIGETLVKRKFGLPDIDGQTGVEILYQQSASNHLGESVKLVDYKKTYSASLSQLPADAATTTYNGLAYFTKLPPHFRNRFWYDPNTSVRKLFFKGDFVATPAGVEEPIGYVLMNVITGREKTNPVHHDGLLDISADPAYQTAVNSLIVQAAQARVVLPNTTNESLALTAGFATAGGYVTIAFNNSTNLNSEADTISLSILQVSCPTYRGEIEVVDSDNPFDEKLTLRHSGDFAGKADAYTFQWRTLPPHNGLPPTDPPESWAPYGAVPSDGQGALDITIEGPGLFTLTDNYFICRYKPNPTNLVCSPGADPNDRTGWSPWTSPMLAEGWIKRVLNRINPYEQRFSNLRDPTVTINTIVSMLQQAGKRWIGNIPLNQQAANDSGLIELYETILKRGIDLSIEGTPPVNYGPANDALLLAAGRISDLYMLLGNEAYADAADPTIAYGTDDHNYGNVASSIHCFMNMTDSLIEEELDLLRGRDDTLLPDIHTYPFYNRLTWNYTHGIDGGEVAYSLNYNVFSLQDAASKFPQGHGDAWGHYLTALKTYYRLLRDPNFTWVPRIEAVIVGGVPVSVDYQDERNFAKAAAALARTASEIVNLTYRYAYVDDPRGQWQGYQDSDTNRAWGVAEWGSRAGQATYFNWVVANALLPDTYHEGYRITEDTIAHVSAASTYNLTDSVITNLFGPGALVDALKNLSPRTYQSRESFLAALDQALSNFLSRTNYEELILSRAQTSGLPEASFSIFQSLKGRVYPSFLFLEAALPQAIGTTEFNLYYQSLIKPWVKVPSGQPATGIQKIDRDTVMELREIAAAYHTIESQVDNADVGLNPLGLAKNAIPFDIDPSALTANSGKTHFEQIYDRAVQGMNNAIAVFNYANNAAQLLRRQADTVNDFQQKVFERENDFTNRLIEAFGYPYPEDIGTAGTYPPGYNGPDIIGLHFNYIDLEDYTGATNPTTTSITGTFLSPTVDTTGAVTYASATVNLNLSTEGLEFIKPAGWTRRKALGEVQRAAGDLIQVRLRLVKGLQDYDNLLSQIEDQADLLQAQYAIDKNEIQILNAGKKTALAFNKKILGLRSSEIQLRNTVGAAVNIADAAAEFLPIAVGVASDVTSAGRGALRLVGAIASGLAGAVADSFALDQIDAQNAKEDAQAANNIELTVSRQVLGIDNQIAQLRQLVRQEPAMRVELYSLREAVLQSAGNYQSVLARGQRILDERVRFHVQTAAQVQEYRYKDMAFRIFRDDAIQKFRAQFDMAARYVYLAAKAYDYETCLLPGDSRGVGQDFLRRIVRSRAIGLIEGGQPIGGSSTIPAGAGDLGLADPLAQMFQNWNQVLKGELGFNNPQTQTTRFSLRSELLRIAPGTAGKSPWQQQLSKYIVTNLWELPEYRKYCSLLSTNQSLPEPAILIPFSTTITFRENFFGWPLAAGDSYYASDRFATKIRSVGVWFANYNSVNGLALTPRIYLIPIGIDMLRSPTGNAGVIREFPVLDQILPTPYVTSTRLTDPAWIPINETVGDGQYADIRRFGTFQAYHDGGYNLSEMTYDSRLIGRSVWNTAWLMIIPSGNLLATGAPDEGIQRFIYGNLVGGGPARDGNGVSDIKITFQTYSYAGN